MRGVRRLCLLCVGFSFANVEIGRRGCRRHAECTARRVSFIYHDPGARNHMLPIIARAEQSLGPSLVEVHDLRATNQTVEQVVREAASRTLFVFGCSMNRAERAGIRAILPAACFSCSVQYIDLPGISTRLDGLDADETADRYILSLHDMQKQRVRHTSAAGRGVVCGSTHVEHILLAAAAAVQPPPSGPLVRPSSCPARGPLVVFFSSSEEPTLALSVVEIVNVLRAAAHALRLATASAACLLVRLHPRSSATVRDQTAAAAATLTSTSFAVVIDRANAVPNARLLRHCELSLSFGSNVALESIALGTQHAFVQQGWPASHSFLEPNFAWFDVPRLRGSVAAMARQLEPLLAASVRTEQVHALREGLRRRMAGSTECAWRQLQRVGSLVDTTGRRLAAADEVALVNQQRPVVVLFLHLPKAGGTSVRHIFAKVPAVCKHWSWPCKTKAKSGCARSYCYDRWGPELFKYIHRWRPGQQQRDRHLFLEWHMGLNFTRIADLKPRVQLHRPNLCLRVITLLRRPDQLVASIGAFFSPYVPPELVLRYIAGPELLLFEYFGLAYAPADGRLACAQQPLACQGVANQGSFWSNPASWTWRNRSYANASAAQWEYAHRKMGSAAGKFARTLALGCAALVEQTMRVFEPIDAVLFLEDNRSYPAVHEFARAAAASSECPSLRETPLPTLQQRTTLKSAATRPGPKRPWQAPGVAALAHELNACSMAAYLALRTKYAWSTSATADLRPP